MKLITSEQYCYSYQADYKLYNMQLIQYIYPVNYSNENKLKQIVD